MRDIAIIPQKIEKQSKITKLEFNFRDDKELTMATKWLSGIIDQEAAEQFVFVLRTMQEETFVNHCDEAVKLLGKNLNEHWGGEESFFDLMPKKTQFMEIRSSEALKNNFRRDNYHSIALIELPQKNNNIYLACDLVYGVITGEGQRDDALLLSYNEGNREDVLVKIAKYYGGKWKIVNILDKKNNNFRHNI